MTELIHDLEKRLRHMHHRYHWTELYLIVGITICVILQIIDMKS